MDDVIARRHRYLGGELPGGLDELLSADVVLNFRPPNSSGRLRQQR